MASPLVAASLAVVQEVVVGLCASSRVAVGAPHHRDASSAGLGWREREARVSGAAGPTSCCSGTVAAAAATARWEGVALACRSAARVTCLGGGWKKRDAARKALEDALGGKKEALDKWNEEIKRRQEAGVVVGKRPWWGKFVGGGGGAGAGGGGGRGGGSGGSGSGRGRGEEPDEIDPDSGRSWDEAKQIAYAFFGLLFVYLVLTQGKAMLAIAVNVLFFVLRGFKRSPSYRPPASKTAASKPSLGPLALGNAEAEVISKWGKD